MTESARRVEVFIRRAGVPDLDGLLELCRSCTKHLDESGIPQWDELYPNREVFEGDINAGSLYVAVLPDGRIGGCIVLNFHQDEEYKTIDWQFTEGKIGVIHRLMVHPALEGNGIARSLLSYAETLAKEQGFAALRLDMFALNPRAGALYEKNGYITRGTVRFRKGEFFCAEKLL